MAGVASGVSSALVKTAITVIGTDGAAVDISLLIEQFGRASLPQRFGTEGGADLVESARGTRRRAIAIALDGLRAGHPEPPGRPPLPEPVTERR